MKKFIAPILILFGMLTSQSQDVLPLYKTVPNSKPAPDKEVNSTEGYVHTTNVSVPTLTIYKPTKPNTQHSAVIICPGGGYGALAMGHEGADVAKALNNFGITAFVLKYRLPDDAIMKDKTIGPLQDVQRAFRIVRERAKEWNINTSKIGVMGFSAGGHLAASASTQYNREVIDNPNRISFRPDFSILIYPVISFTDNLTHMGSRDNLIGKNPAETVITQYSNELQVTPKTPPAFIIHSADDEAVPVGNSIAYYQALIKNKVFSEMLLYPHGGHGYGMNNATTQDKWIDNLKNWMMANKFL
jgi:acetyl esterase/lipase